MDQKNKLFAPRKHKRGVGEKESFSPITIFMLVVLTIYVLSMLFIIFWTLLTSVKYHVDFETNKLGFPRPASPHNSKVIWGWRISNYFHVFKEFFVEPNIETSPGVFELVRVGMGKMFLYAFVYAAGCAFTKALVPMLTAYMCARFNYFFSKVVHTIVIITMILPIVGSLPSELRLAKALGLYDELWGLWIMRGNFLGMYFLVFYGNFKVMPMAYTEAAKIDGASNLQVLLQIILPLVKNTFLTIFLLHFISFWNDYNTPLIYMPSYPTIAYGLYDVTTNTRQQMSQTPYRMAAAVLMLIPIMIIFLLSHNRLLGNLTVGGIKG